MKERIKELIAVIQHECMNNYYGDKPFGSNFYDKHAEEIMKLFPQWIPVSERLPEIPEGKYWITCLVCQEGHVYIADYIGLLGDKPRWEDCGSAGMYGVTHWQDLPELPK